MFNNTVISAVENPPSLNIPQKFLLSQNYPNPFNPVTIIKYQIPAVVPNQPDGKTGEGKNLMVSLKVYDILGREVTTLVNEEKPAGIYEVRFNAGSLASGVYFYQLRAGSFIQTKKMILLK